MTAGRATVPGTYLLTEMCADADSRRGAGLAGRGGLLDQPCHQHAAGARRITILTATDTESVESPTAAQTHAGGDKGAGSNDKNSAAAPASDRAELGRPGLPDHGLGCSRGGFTSKLHLITDGRGLQPISIGLTGGNVNDTTMLEPALGEIRVPRRGSGRPRTCPDGLLGDKGYSSRSNRQRLARRGITATIPERADQLAHRARRGSKGSRPYAFDAERYKRRNVVERCFSRLKRWRGVTTRYDKKAINYRGGIVLASLIIWLKS